MSFSIKGLYNKSYIGSTFNRLLTVYANPATITILGRSVKSHVISNIKIIPVAGDLTTTTKAEAIPKNINTPKLLISIKLKYNKINPNNFPDNPPITKRGKNIPPGNPVE